jgi:hypothetical protein
MIRIDRGMGRPKIEVDSVNFEPYRTQTFRDASGEKVTSQYITARFSSNGSDNVLARRVDGGAWLWYDGYYTEGPFTMWSPEQREGE